MHRAENQQKEFKKKSRKKMKTYNSYVKPKFLAKKISLDSLPQAEKVKKVNDTFIAKSDKYTIAVPLTSTGNIILKETIPKAFKKSKKNTYKFMISLPNKENSTFSGKAKVAKENSIVYKDYQENTDIVVQALKKGSIRILTILNDADAPTKFRYKVAVPKGGIMKKLKNGAIAIIDANKNFKGGFAPPWAVDKKGQKIPTHYEIENDKLIQIVEHLNINTIYPVVADPYRGHDLIDTWEWEYVRNNRGRHYFNDWILNVHTTYWARVYGGDYYRGLVGWNELYSKAHSSGLRYNLISMRNQYICHAVYAFWMPREYHLEEWRPVISWKATKDAKCNPSGHINH